MAALAGSEEALNEDVHYEILLRVPPRVPRLLVRCAVVCRAWRRILQDPVFCRRYRARHHRHPPMVGFVVNSRAEPIRAGFVPTVGFPNPDSSLEVPEGGHGLRALESRHGRVLFERMSGGRRDSPVVSLVVWDPLSGKHQELPLPEAAGGRRGGIAAAAILCDDGNQCTHVACHAGPFLVVCIAASTEGVLSAFAFSSTTGLWTPTASLRAPAGTTSGLPTATTLVGSTIFVPASRSAILRYEMRGEAAAARLSFVSAPVDLSSSGRSLGMC